MPDCVYVGRPGPYGNPFKIGEVNTDTGQIVTPEKCLEYFAFYLRRKYKGPDLAEFLAPLKGKDLACWCAIWKCQNGHRFGNQIPHSRVIKYCPKCSTVLSRVPCHADVLLELANGGS